MERALFQKLAGQCYNAAMDSQLVLLATEEMGSLQGTRLHIASHILLE